MTKFIFTVLFFPVQVFIVQFLVFFCLSMAVFFCLILSFIGFFNPDKVMDLVDKVTSVIKEIKKS